MTQARNHFDARADAWRSAAEVRRSRRTFGGPASAEQLDALSAACHVWRPWADARVELAVSPTVDVFGGIRGSYGTIKGARDVLLVIVDDTSAHSQQHAGYTGEGLVLEATALGLGTCWVGGFFDPTRARKLVPNLLGSERVVAVSPVGVAADDLSAAERTMRGLAGSHARKSLDEIAPGARAWPAWAQAASACARIAPSAVNRQPWRLRVDGSALTVARDSRTETPRVTKALDCGIAMLHAELGAAGAGVSGTWTDLDSGLDVARFDAEVGA